MTSQKTTETRHKAPVARPPSHPSRRMLRSTTTLLFVLSAFAFMKTTSASSLRRADAVQETKACRCEYPYEDYYSERRILRRYISLNVDYIEVNGETILPRSHNACRKVEFICPHDEARSPIWSYHCKAVDTAEIFHDRDDDDKEDNTLQEHFHNIFSRNGSDIRRGRFLHARIRDNRHLRREKNKNNRNKRRNHRKKKSNRKRPRNREQIWRKENKKTERFYPRRTVFLPADSVSCLPSTVPSLLIPSESPTESIDTQQIVPEDTFFPTSESSATSEPTLAPTAGGSVTRSQDDTTAPTSAHSNMTAAPTYSDKPSSPPTNDLPQTSSSGTTMSGGNTTNATTFPSPTATSAPSSKSGSQTSSVAITNETGSVDPSSSPSSSPTNTTLFPSIAPSEASLGAHNTTIGPTPSQAPTSNYTSDANFTNAPTESIAPSVGDTMTPSVAPSAGNISQPSSASAPYSNNATNGNEDSSTTPSFSPTENLPSAASMVPSIESSNGSSTTFPRNMTSETPSIAPSMTPPSMNSSEMTSATPSSSQQPSRLASVSPTRPSQAPTTASSNTRVSQAPTPAQDAVAPTMVPAPSYVPSRSSSPTTRRIPQDYSPSSAYPTPSSSSSSSTTTTQHQSQVPSSATTVSNSTASRTPDQLSSSTLPSSSSSSSAPTVYPTFIR